MQEQCNILQTKFNQRFLILPDDTSIIRLLPKKDTEAPIFQRNKISRTDLFCQTSSFHTKNAKQIKVNCLEANFRFKSNHSQNLLCYRAVTIMYQLALILWLSITNTE
jgi:hypothetical protein